MYHNKFKRFVCFKKDVRILFAINIKYQLMTLVHIVILNRGGGAENSHFWSFSYQTSNGLQTENHPVLNKSKMLRELSCVQISKYAITTK